MQDCSSDHAVPLSLMLKEAYSAEKRAQEEFSESMSEASSHDGYFDSVSDLQDDEGINYSAELSAFLSQDEINKSLDLAREAIDCCLTEETNYGQEFTHFFGTPVFDFPETSETVTLHNTGLAQEDASLPSYLSFQSALPETESNTDAENIATQLEHSPSNTDSSKTTAVTQSSPLQAESSAFKKFERHFANISDVAKDTQSQSQGSIKVLQTDSSSKSEAGNKAASFIEELSSIFRVAGKSKGKNHNEDSSSPDSGYLSPKTQSATHCTSSDNSSKAPQQENVHCKPLSGVDMEAAPNEQDDHVVEGMAQADDVSGSVMAPRFIQKLKSQEVAEGSKVLLECRVIGNPTPQVRWFCEGTELTNSPDIQICQNGDFNTLVITEAFEDDTGRYTCVAENIVGSDTTSAEVYIEGASSTDSEGEGSMLKAKPGAMPQAQKKTTSVSLTIGSPFPKAGVTTAVIQPLSVPSQQCQSPTTFLYRQPGLSSPFSAPVFTKVLQDVTASEGQVVVLECRVRGASPLHIQWFRQGEEIQDSPDFRILQKKPRSASEPEEICTLVIAETFPEDAGTFSCVACNQFGSVTSTAQLFVCPATEESTRNGIMDDDFMDSDFQQFPPPPPLTEVSCLELPPKKSVESVKPNVAELQLQISPVESRPNGFQSDHGMNGMLNGKTDNESSMPSPQVLLSPVKEPPPLPAKPKLDPLQIQKLQNQIRLEQEGFVWQQDSVLQTNPPPSPPLPPPPSFQELESSQLLSPTAQMNVLNTHSPSTMQPTSTFNYARPKQFIAAQNIGPSSGYVTPSSGSSSSSLPSPMSPSTPQKQFNRVILPAYQQQYSNEGDTLYPPSSPSPPPPPPPVFSPPASFAQDNFPLPPPPPPLPPTTPPSSYSPCSSDRMSPFASHTPSAFLSSILPSQPISPINTRLPKGVTPLGFPRKNSRTMRIASDEEIQGTKDAVIQDLERKLRLKEDLLNNGNQRLTYEEKMARRLLGADTAATVFTSQDSEDDSVPQEYKVSSLEQRLISETEHRLERSATEDSDDEVQHGDIPEENCVAPFFENKLKHYKVFEGMAVKFTCKVIGAPKPKIYWFKDGMQISKTNEHYKIQGEPDGTCSLETTYSTLDDDGIYTIMAANPQGRVSCTGRLMVQAVNQRGRTVRSPTGMPHVRRPRSRSRDSGEENEPIQERFFRPHFLQAPGDMIVQEGKLCRMDCKVSGLPTPDLSWQLNGRLVRSDSSHKMLVRENGVHSLIIEPVTARDAGIYTCIASNRAGQNSFNLQLIVTAKEELKAPFFIEKLQNTGVAEGYPVRLECRVVGVPQPQIFWKKENESFTQNTERISTHKDNHGYLCLLIQGTKKEDAGWYTVSAKNEAGIISCTARLDVYTHWPQQPSINKPKKVRPSASRYAALSDQGLDIKAAFVPEANPVHLIPHHELVESDDL
ncbi:palladin isoform X2 [Protopterus annectens]|uniref:palladin isoform X2 n=1 Tax=Protopterus annectens TaxID=7888 RepID=UPI001CFB568C|nr:palladin isoform X2 [Protopterus annectens]